MWGDVGKGPLPPDDSSVVRGCPSGPKLPAGYEGLGGVCRGGGLEEVELFPREERRAGHPRQKVYCISPREEKGRLKVSQTQRH